MTTTYINDNKSSIYPFATGSYLPFSPACIIGAGVCVQLKTADYTVYSIMVTGVELSESSVSMVLAVVLRKVNSSASKSLMCRTESYIGKASVVSTTQSDECFVSAWVVPGTVSKADFGAYRVGLELDRAAVTVIGAGNLGNYSSLSIDGVEYAAPECLKLDFKGVLEIEYNDTRTTVINNVVSIPEDYSVSVHSSSLDEYYASNNEVENITDDYNQVLVLRVNNERDDGTSAEIYTGSYVSNANLNAMGYGSTLYVKIEAPSGSVDSASSDFIVCTLENVTPVSTITVGTVDPDNLPGAPAGTRTNKWICRNDSIGDAVILTIHGTDLFPNCYKADEDDAGGDLKYADGQ